MTETAETRWFQYPGVWAVFLIPFSAVLFGIVMLVVTSIHPDDVVVDDYYKAGMAINRSLEMDSKAAELEVLARGEFSADGIRFNISGVDDSAVVFRLFHVTDRERDQEYILVAEGQGSYYTTADGLEIDFARPGVWYAELIGAETKWRLRRRLVMPITEVELQP